MNQPYIWTHCGKQVPLLNPQPDDIEWLDIAFALANINRYTGHVGLYSVAQHSGLVWSLVTDEHPELGLEALLHDAHEAYIGDVSTPMKNALGVLNKGYGDNYAFDVIEEDFVSAIRKKAGLGTQTHNARIIVKRADLTALAIEKRDLFARQDPTPWGVLDGINPPPKRLHRIPAAHALESFIRAMRLEGLDVPRSSFG